MRLLLLSLIYTASLYFATALSIEDTKVPDRDWVSSLQLIHRLRSVSLTNEHLCVVRY
jgi:hypothetical protein